ncbi:right-handed parallel beta-helix repeat-containing protein [Streptomyces sp. NBC_01016]|uniref:right-handed parallel beta-helix repeat-containing protein n=1 Tax=Streptomyces sp. NBC_01016 TaxID=2903720 RepID=UPI00225AB512|nr:right-handed parallel beta-helix repeat-containing protein [Streptomyces sp. NBC_01016]MCX4827192.1 right-handed parallel beta-helix repeat-containing protein [Streptomyces sp. NBC_01016]
MATPVEWRPGMDITAPRLESMNQRQTFMVTNYGADSSGGTNAAPGIQAALNAARDLGGAQVLVPPGVYLIGQTLRIYTNTRLTLMQGAEFRRNVAATMLLNGDGGQSLGGYTGHSRIIIEGGLWNMRGTASGLTGNAMCISIGHATDITIRDLEIRDVSGYHGIEMNSTSHGLVENCKFRGYVDNTADKSRGFSEAVQIDLAKSAGEFGGFGPYDHTPCEDILVSGCHFGASGTSGTTAWPRGVGSHSATIGRWHRRIRIANNSFEGLLQYAISAYSYEDLTVVGNTFVACGSGVRLRSNILTDSNDTTNVDGVDTHLSQPMRNLSISGNTFRDMGNYADAIEARGEPSGTVLNVAISGNVFDNTGTTANGIRLQYVERASVTGNAIANTGNTGISLEDCNRITVGSNQVTWGHGYGITAVDCTQVTIADCQICYPGKGGILLDQASSDIQLRGNFIKGPSRDSNDGYWGINISGGCSSVTVTGNKTRPYGSAPEGKGGFRTENTVTLVHRFGNDWRGSTWVGAALTDPSTPNTSATDIT